MLPEKLQRKFRALTEAYAQKGYSLFLVGGAVRDLLMGKEPGDFDFTTDATPQATMELFRRVIPTGLLHGTVTVLLQGESYEITTFRIDGAYSDHRHPESVVFTSSLAQDLERRDFTINALALNLKTYELIDLHRGQEDLKNKTLRAIGVPEERFQEDALRMLRACRFLSKLGFNLSEKTFEAIKIQKNLIQKVSLERIRVELDKLLLGPYPAMGLRVLVDSGLLSVLMERLGQKGEWGGSVSSFAALKDGPLDPLALRVYFYSKWITGLKSDELAENVEQLMHTLTYSNKESSEVRRFLQGFGSHTHPEGAVELKSGLNLMQSRNLTPIFDFFQLLDADFSPKKIEENWQKWSLEPIFLSEIQVKGQDLLNMGYEGKTVGSLLKKIQRWVWLHPEDNLPASQWGERLKTLFTA